MFSLADSSSTAMALDTSVIKESRTPDAACPSLLDVSALDSPVSPALSHEVSSDWGRPFLRLSNGAGQLSNFLWVWSLASFLLLALASNLNLHTNFGHAAFDPCEFWRF